MDHLNLATAYLEMALNVDAVREAATALACAPDSTKMNQALALLLSEALLAPGALDALRGRLTTN